MALVASRRWNFWLALSFCFGTALACAQSSDVLPSVEVNCRIQPNWSVYGQYGRASIIPFSTVFDVAGAEVAQTPPPTVATAYQGGTVLKLNKISMDADAFHIHFVNQYASYTRVPWIRLSCFQGAPS